MDVIFVIRVRRSGTKPEEINKYLRQAQIL